jgi:hypothetical protein
MPVRRHSSLSPECLSKPDEKMGRGWGPQQSVAVSGGLLGDWQVILGEGG